MKKSKKRKLKKLAKEAKMRRLEGIVLRRDNNAYRNHIEQLAAALYELVTLKHMKDIEGTSPEYERRKAAAWKVARELVGFPNTPWLEEGGEITRQQFESAAEFEARKVYHTTQGIHGPITTIRQEGPQCGQPSHIPGVDARRDGDAYFGPVEPEPQPDVHVAKSDQYNCYLGEQNRYKKEP